MQMVALFAMSLVRVLAPKLDSGEIVHRSETILMVLQDLLLKVSGFLVME